MKQLRWFLCAVAIASCGVLISCNDDLDVLPKDELDTGGNGEGSDPIEHGPPTSIN